MLKPPALGENAVIGVAALASPVRQEYVDAGVAELERRGFRIRLAAHLYDRHRFTAGTAAERLADFTTLWDDPDVEGIFCARGGYGSLELLEHLDPERFRENPRVFLGSSDLTAVLGFLGRAGVVSFHGPMVAQQMARGTYHVENLLELMGTTSPSDALSVRDDVGLESLHDGEAEGRLYGGCLTLVAALVGTDYLPSFEDGILFLEDIQVKPYQIHRLLTQLQLSGRLRGVRGVVFGQMLECDQHPDQGYTLQEMLRDWSRPLGVPVLFGYPSGHTRTPAMTLPLGTRVRLDGRGLHLLEGAVR